MPPRRSTRSARPSAEPEPHPPSSQATSKRKRAPSVAKDSNENEDPKPKSRASTRARTSTRSRGSLKELAEVEEEEEEEEKEEEPPVKKSRKSPEVEGENEEVEAKPKGRKPAATKKVPVRRVSSRKFTQDDDNDEQPTSKGRGSVAPARRTSGRGSIRTKKEEKVVDIPDSDSDAEVEAELEVAKPKPRGRAAPAKTSKIPVPTSSRGRRKAVEEVEGPEQVNETIEEQEIVEDSQAGEEDVPESEPEPPSKGRKPKSQPKRKLQTEEQEVPVSTRQARTRTSTAISVRSKGGNAESEDEVEAKPKAKGRAAAKGSKAPASRGKGKAKVEEDDEADGAMEIDEDEDAQASEGSEPESDPQPPSKGRKAKSQPKVKANKVKASTRRTIVEDPDSELESDHERKPIRKASTAGIPPPPKPVPVPDEEEKSLLDGPPIPATQPLKVIEEEEPQGPKSRLVIHKMVLVNFKSYAGRQEIGPFHKSFSSIVGPNGSGKSNTIDALLFVFGYRASKMRQGRLSELIHNSARYPDLDECGVEVHFREIVDLPGPDAFEVVSGSQLVVARTAYKNNSSKYIVNGSQSSFTEVQTLLKARGIDLDHKRFLILQGEVESIAQMKPKAQNEHEDGLLEYLEDIIGTSRYKSSLEDALAAAETLAEERAEKLSRLRLVEKEKKRLEEGKREAEAWLRLHNEWMRARSRLFQWYLWKCLLNEEMYNEKIAGVEKELAEEVENNKDDIMHLEMLEKHYEERGKVYEEVKAAVSEATKDLSAHEKQEVGLEERRKHANSKAKKLRKSIHEDENTKATAQRTIQESSEKMEREKKQVEDYEASLDKEEKVLESIRDSLKDKTQVFHDQIEVKQKELQPWTAKINAKQAEVDVATSERDALAKKAEGVKVAMKEATAGLSKLQDDHGQKLVELEEVKSDKAKLMKEAKAGEKKLQEMQSQVQHLRSKASSSRQKADEAKASQAASTSQNKVLDSLTRLRNAGRISGFHGRLGSLGTIPDKYDVAVSTACGALNNLVVDTVEQGQACIEYLRKQNVGRASFLVLEKLKQTNGLEKIATPENVPRLFDLIKPKEPRFAPAFFKGVGNTLVADDLEQANRIAFGGQRRWRVVTLAGQLIDASGTMSGGGNHVARGGMSSKLAADAVTPETLKSYEEESEQASKQLDDILNELRQVEREVDELGKAGPRLDITLEKIELDIKNGSKRIAEAEKRVRELKSQSKPDAGDIARIAALDEEIASFSEELEELQAKSGEIERAIKDLEKKILDIGGAKLLTQKSKVDGIRLHINLSNDEITKAEVAKAKAEKDLVKLEGALETNNASLQEVEGEIEELTEQLSELEGYVTELRSKVEAAQTAAENQKDDLENLKTELDAKTEEIQAFRQKEMTLQQALTDLQREATDNMQHTEHWQLEHDKLKLEEIDSDDEEEEETPENAQAKVEVVAEKVDAEAMAEDGAEDDGEPKVKAEPGQETVPKKKAHNGAPSYELYVYSAEELAKFKKREMIADTELLDEKLKNAKPNMNALKEYRKREEEFLKRAKDLENITNLRDEQKQKYDSLRKQRLDEFMTGFNLISMKLKEMYQMITLGGNAELELVDSMDPFSEGIIFSVMPPKKSWKNISNLSGGEKTLSSLALVFALHVFKPTPLYFMDEIDAALDFRNVSIVANYIKDRTKNAQFIIISLRNDMFELSHRLIGIYKTSNATQSISIDNHALTAMAGPVKASAAVA